MSSWDKWALYNVADRMLGDCVAQNAKPEPVCLLWNAKQGEHFAGVALKGLLGLKRAHLVSDILRMDVAVSASYTEAPICDLDELCATPEDEKCYVDVGPKVIACVECKSLQLCSTVIYIAGKPLMVITEDTAQAPPWGFILSPFRAPHYQRYKPEIVIKRITNECIELTNGVVLPLKHKSSHLRVVH